MRVFICSRLRGDILSNINKALEYSHWACRQGASAFAPHAFYTSFLDDTIQAERDIGIKAGNDFLEVCEELWVFVEAGRLSSGMVSEIEYCIDNNIPIRWHSVKDEGHGLMIEKLHHCPIDEIPPIFDLLPKEEAIKNAVEAISFVENALKNGVDYMELTESLDSALGNTMKERDLDAEAAWEGATADLD